MNMIMNRYKSASYLPGREAVSVFSRLMLWAMFLLLSLPEVLGQERGASSDQSVKASLEGMKGSEAAAEQKARFVPPFDFPITFSGNFGELRANHFHGGLDFKTQGVEGKQVRALADGYISRLAVTHGSGYVMDVTYANGYTTINRHLSAFTGEPARRIEELQYRQESWEVELKLNPGEYPVKAGEVIALSGNTGYSFGPHLHLDMIEDATGDYIDPLPFFASQVKDHTAPRAEAIMLIPRRGKGVVMGGTLCRQFPPRPKQTLTAWGWIGAAIKAHDYMDGVHNRYGVHTVELEVDGQPVFRSVVDRFAPEETRYINSWNLSGFMKSVIDPGCRLRMLHDLNGHRGWVHINEERPYLFIYRLTDALGNRSEVRFTVHGRRSAIPSSPYPLAKIQISPVLSSRLSAGEESSSSSVSSFGEEHLQPDAKSSEGVSASKSSSSTAVGNPSSPVSANEAVWVKYHWCWNQLHVMQEPGVQLVVPRGMLYDDVTLRYAVRADSGDVAFTYQLHDEALPLHNSCELRIRLRHRPLADSTKYYVASVHQKGHRSYVGGRYEQGEMVARIRQLGTYTVAIDTIPPVIAPINRNSWARTGTITFSAKDSETGIRHYRGTIDGHFALFGKPSAIRPYITCRLDPSRIKRGQRHQLVFTVTDNCGNSTTYQGEFYW